MKAITLAQPWATLVAIGAKRIETRGWATAYRGPLAIHAGKGLGPVGGKRGLRALCFRNPFLKTLVDAGINVPGLLGTDVGDVFPLGAVVAIVNLCDVHRASCLADAISQRELAFGDYSPGRYAWLLEDVQQLDAPARCKGALGLWEWQP